MSDTNEPGTADGRGQRRRRAESTTPVDRSEAVAMPPALPPDVPLIPVPIADTPVAAPADAASESAPAPAAAPEAGGVGAPLIETPSPDVAPGTSASLPGVHRGGFRRALTEPVIVSTAEHDDSPRVEVLWAPEPPAPLPRSAPWALTFAVLGLVVSLLVGWGFLIGIVGSVLAIVALRRPWESRGVAAWALSLSVLSLVYSAGWLWWASTQKDLFAGGLFG